jgi:hypothetical protein
VRISRALITSFLLVLSLSACAEKRIGLNFLELIMETEDYLGYEIAVSAYLKSDGGIAKLYLVKDHAEMDMDKLSIPFVSIATSKHCSHGYGHFIIELIERPNGRVFAKPVDREYIFYQKNEQGLKSIICKFKEYKSNF